MKLLIFDVDGVLGQEELIDKARKENQYKYIAEKFNISPKEAKDRYEESRASLLAEICETSVQVFTNLGFSRDEYFRIVDKVSPEGLIAPHKNCENTIKELSKDYTIVAYSNTPKKATIKTLKILKIDKYFDKVFSAEEFEESKPSINNLEYIMENMNSKAEDSVMIGNSLKKDILPAQELGIQTILFDPYGRYSLPEVDHVIKDLNEIISLV